MLVEEAIFATKDAPSLGLAWGAVSSCKRSDSLLRFRRTLLHHFQLLPGAANASRAATPHAGRAMYRLVWQSRKAATAGRSAVGRTVANLDEMLARMRASYADFEVVSPYLPISPNISLPRSSSC